MRRPACQFFGRRVHVSFGMAQGQLRAVFFAAVHLCMGLYNCLPFGVLDGARLLALLVPARGLPILERFQRAGLCVFLTLAGLAALLAPLPFEARCAAALAPCYLLLQQTGRRRT